MVTSCTYTVEIIVKMTSYGPSQAYDISKHQPCKEVENLPALSVRMPLTATSNWLKLYKRFIQIDKRSLQVE